MTSYTSRTQTGLRQEHQYHEPPPAPRPHRWRTVPAPPKMEKHLFDRCGLCTRAFGFLSRKRNCANCGFVYCSDCCTEKVKLVKFQGYGARDHKVCDYCKEFLRIDRMPSQILHTTSVRSLREYIEVYGLSKGMPFVEKTDLVNTILNADITEFNEQVFRQSTPGFRDWYKNRRRNSKSSRSPPSDSTSTFPGMTRPSSSRSEESPTETASKAFQTGVDRLNETIRQTSNSANDLFGKFFSPTNSSSLGTEATPSEATARRSGGRERAFSANFERQRRPYADHGYNTPGPPPAYSETPGRRATRDDNTSTYIERERRPYSVSPEIPSRPTRSGTLSVDDLSLNDPVEPAPFERQRRQYASTLHSPATSPQPRPTSASAPSSPTIDLRDLVQKGTDISTLSTSTLLTIMRQNNCPLPPGALEKDDLVERVEEMASFVLPTTEAEKPPKVRDEDEDDCKICFERVADYCLVPCGHTGFCFMCARKMSACPFCKKEVGHAQKLWKV